jgi:hypothetical protein
MPRTHTKIRLAIALSAVIAALGVASTTQARLIGDPPVNVNRTQPVKVKKGQLKTRRFDGGFGRLSGTHVYNAAEAKTE